MNILLIYPPHLQFRVTETIKISIGGFVPPLGLLYLASMLENNGHNVTIIDCTAEKTPEDAVLRALPTIDIVGMTVYSGKLGRESSLRIARIVKNHDPDIPLMLGGSHLSLFPEQALIEHQAQVGVQGEAEHRINTIIDAFAGHIPFAQIPGITYDDHGILRNTEPSPQLQDLDSLPFPARHLVRRYDYGYSGGVKLIPGVVASMMTSRGCSFRCRFCQQAVFLPHSYTHSIPRITAEIDAIVNQGYTSIAFADDNFLAHKQRTMRIMDHIISQGYDLTLWILNARADSADRELYEKLRKAGVEHIVFGVESGDQDILSYYNKNITLDQIRKAITLSHEMGFFTTAHFILGAPIETPRHIQHTIAFIRLLPLDNIFIRELGYGAHSPLWQEAVDHGKINPNEDLVIAGRERDLGHFTTSQLQHYCNQVYYAFILNPRYLIRQARYALEHKNPRFLRLGVRILLKTMI
jgi:anaerobic magnesium-protoporphyrin IX monomethyl ester cyclase